jgi:hypothetical protein
MRWTEQARTKYVGLPLRNFVITNPFTQEHMRTHTGERRKFLFTLFFLKKINNTSQCSI